VNLGDFLNSEVARNKACREVTTDREAWPTVRIYAVRPWTKGSDIILKPYDRLMVEPEGFAEFGDRRDIEEWGESFDEADDPTQELIDYVISLETA